MIGRKSGKAVRVAPTAVTMANNKKSKFFSDYRIKGLPASSVPAEIADSLVENVMNVPDEKILFIGEIFDYQIENHEHTFDSFVCEECGEMTVEAYGRVKGDKKVCIPCSGWEA
ncbi:TraR/DksA C4-type zinc finger protein [Tepidibacillus marianensis]|uniref:TraR/DksA C4-type zinc finger protein n=1 Tax=Tepidibacillus marianensis TaxID=3131995 RepID=UPI0030CC6620